MYTKIMIGRYITSNIDTNTNTNTDTNTNILINKNKNTIDKKYDVS